MSYCICSDFGYGLNKLYDGQKFIVFKSILANASAINYTSVLSGSDELKNLSVKVKEGNIDLNFFVGDFALRQGKDIIQILDNQKFMNPLSKILMKTGVSLFLRESSIKDIDIVTGLPISFYDDANKDSVNSLLKGHHNLTFDWNVLKKPSQNVEFNVNNIDIIPQPVGTLYDLILDENGNIINQDLAGKTIGIIDIGFGTTDLTVFRQLEYIGRSSRSVGKAVKDVCSNVLDWLYTQTSEELGVHDIEKVLQSKAISIKGKHYDLTMPIEMAIKSVFNHLQTQQRILFSAEKDLDTYIICGGGAYLFADLFVQSFGNDVSVIVPENPHLSNVIGYHKFHQLTQKSR